MGFIDRINEADGDNEVAVAETPKPRPCYATTYPCLSEKIGRSECACHSCVEFMRDHRQWHCPEFRRDNWWYIPDLAVREWKFIRNHTAYLVAHHTPDEVLKNLDKRMSDSTGKQLV